MYAAFIIIKSTGDKITVYQGTNSAGGMAGRTGVAGTNFVGNFHNHWFTFVTINQLTP